MEIKPIIKRKKRRILQKNRKQATLIARHSASCRVLFFVLEKSVVMVYNKLLNFAGVTGDYGQLRFRERNAYEKRK